MKNENIAFATVIGLSAAVTSVCVFFMLKTQFNWVVDDTFGAGSLIWISILFGVFISFVTLKIRIYEDSKKDCTDLDLAPKRKSNLNNFFFLIVNAGVVLALSNNATTLWFYVGCVLILIGIFSFAVSYIKRRN